MIEVVEQWPGDVCGDCWEQWDGEGVSFRFSTSGLGRRLLAARSEE